MVRRLRLLELAQSERRELQSLAGRRSGMQRERRLSWPVPRVSRTNRWRPGLGLQRTESEVSASARAGGAARWASLGGAAHDQRRADRIAAGACTRGHAAARHALEIAREGQSEWFVDLERSRSRKTRSNLRNGSLETSRLAASRPISVTRQGPGEHLGDAMADDAVTDHRNRLLSLPTLLTHPRRRSPAFRKTV
jgi:hypothetical protein